MNEDKNSKPEKSNLDDIEFWNTELNEILFFGKTKQECRILLEKILIEYDPLIKRMKYV